MFLRDTGVEDSVLLPEDVSGSGVTLRATDVDEPFPRVEDAEEDEVRRPSEEDAEEDDVRRPAVEDAEEEDGVRRTLEVVVLSAVGGFCEEVTAEVLPVVCDAELEDEDALLLRRDVCCVWDVDDEDEEDVRRLCASEPVWETARTAIIAAIAFIYAFIIKIFQETGMLRKYPWLNTFSAYGRTVHLQ